MLSGRYNYNFDKIAATAMGLDITTKAKKAIVTFKKTKGATAYQVQYRLKGKKWSNMAKSTKKVKVTSKKLKKGKKYQVRVRTTDRISYTKFYTYRDNVVKYKVHRVVMRKYVGSRRQLTGSEKEDAICGQLGK